MGIATNDVLPLCDANNGVLITLDIMPTGGGEGFTYQWQEAGLDLGGQTETNLAVPFLENSTSYQLVATSNEGCGNVPSNEIGVPVYDPLEIADAQGSQTICFMTDPEPLFSTGAVGGSSDYSYQWEENSEGDWVEMAEETETSVSPGTLSASSSYRLRVADNEGCGVVASVPVFVEVLSEFFPGTVQASLKSSVSERTLLSALLEDKAPMTTSQTCGLCRWMGKLFRLTLHSVNSNGPLKMRGSTTTSIWNQPPTLAAGRWSQRASTLKSSIQSLPQKSLRQLRRHQPVLRR